MSGVRRTRMLLTMVCVVTLGATVAATAGCGVELGVAYASDGYPPESYIVTAEPVYFEGRASYWYGNHWYYRDGGRWSYYRTEPRVLYQRRIQGPTVHRGVAPVRGHAVAPARVHVAPVRVHVAPVRVHVAPVRVHPVARPAPRVIVQPHGRPVAPARAQPAPQPRPRPAVHPQPRRPGEHR